MVHELDATNPHYRIGALGAELAFERVHVAKLQEEINMLRACMIARLTILETLPASADLADLRLQVDITIERLGDALYPASAGKVTK